MSKLGLAAIAGNAAFENNRLLEDRDYLAKQRAYQQQIMDTEAAGLADAGAAKTAANKLAAARANAGMETLPQETQNRIAGLGLESGDLAFRKEQQPAVQANAVKATTVQGAGLDSTIAQIPENEKSRVAGNASADVARRQSALVDFSKFISTNDKPGALNYLNSYAESDPALKGKKFVDIHAVGDKTDKGDDRAFSLVAEDGSNVSIPYAAVQHAQNMAKTGKYKFFTDDATGRVIAGNENTGSVEEKIAADPTRAKLGANGKPSEMQMQFTFLTQHPEGPQLSKEKATEMITKGSHKTAEERYHAYKTELVKAAAGLGRPLDMAKINEQAAGLAGFDPNKTPGLQSGSNTPTQFKVNPKYESLFKP